MVAIVQASLSTPGASALGRQQRLSNDQKALVAETGSNLSRKPQPELLAFLGMNPRAPKMLAEDRVTLPLPFGAYKDERLSTSLTKGSRLMRRTSDEELLPV